MHSLTNVPTKASGLEIRGIADGEQIDVVCMSDNGRDWSRMTTAYLGDHMLAKPAELRRMYANDLATAIRMGRDAGYEQAKAEIRAVLGVRAERGI